MKKWYYVLIFLAAALVAARFFFMGRATPTVLPPDLRTGPSYAPYAAPAPSSGVTVDATPLDFSKLQILDQILESKNDNDPRMDTELRSLTPQAKTLFEQKYDRLSPEKRNQRGTIVFLIGRDLSTPQDLTFLSAVLQESPCLSLQDCSHESPGAPDHEGASAITLAYPQIMALKQLEAYIARPDRDPKLAEEAAKLIDAAKNSPIAAVARTASGSPHP